MSNNKTANAESFFGVHLTLDCYGGNKKLLNDFRLVYDALEELPSVLEMRKLHPPYVVVAPPITEKDQGGISGFVMIAESHISIHTFPFKGFASADIYTCKSEIDEKKVVNYFKRRFGIKEIELGVYKRGKKFQ